LSRSVLVTGGNRGIGLAIAEAFLHAGDKVAVTYRSDPPPAGLFGVKCDVTDAAAVDDAFAAVEAEQGPVEVMVSNAGITRDGLLIRMSEADLVDVIDANLLGPARVAKRAAMGMVKAKRGRMVFVSSAVGMAGEKGQANYAASKSGLIGLARSIAREYGSRGITANIVAPGYTQTDMTAGLSETVIEAMLARIPLGRAAQPNEIAAAVVFLASEGAAYITGAVLPVDGGGGMGH
jgi:3-oxoacyl-[acyl-carrier protein] reductase